jgi:hypothetical protein
MNTISTNQKSLSKENLIQNWTTFFGRVCFDYNSLIKLTLMSGLRQKYSQYLHYIYRELHLEMLNHSKIEHAIISTSQF